MSKGSSPRPFDVDRNTFESNWDAIFRNKFKDADAKNKHDVVSQNKTTPRDSASGDDLSKGANVC